MTSRVMISIVTPAYNEEDAVRECAQRVRDAMETLEKVDYEHIFVDNRSSDSTWSTIKAISEEYPQVKGIRNLANYGPFVSMSVGLKASTGEFVVPFLPVDCQDPPELIPEMYRLIQKAEVVAGVRKGRSESLTLKISRSVYYFLIKSITKTHVQPNSGEFCMISRHVADYLSESKDYYPYVRGQIFSLGLKTEYLEYKWGIRKHGKSRNTFRDLYDQAVNGVISSSNLPIRLISVGGAFLSMGALAYAIYSLLLGILRVEQGIEPGIRTLIVGQFFFAGLIILALGILGEYVGAIHSQVRSAISPKAIETLNFSEDLNEKKDLTSDQF